MTAPKVGDPDDYLEKGALVIAVLEENTPPACVCAMMDLVDSIEDQGSTTMMSALEKLLTIVDQAK